MKCFAAVLAVVAVSGLAFGQPQSVVGQMPTTGSEMNMSREERIAVHQAKIDKIIQAERRGDNIHLDQVGSLEEFNAVWVPALKKAGIPDEQVTRLRAAFEPYRKAADQLRHEQSALTPEQCVKVNQEARYGPFQRPAAIRVPQTTSPK